jgi:hypothetical protein
MGDPGFAAGPRHTHKRPPLPVQQSGTRGRRALGIAGAINALVVQPHFADSSENRGVSRTLR